MSVYTTYLTNEQINKIEELLINTPNIISRLK